MLPVFIKYLSYLIPAALGIGGVIGIVRFKALSPPLRTLVCYVLLALVADQLFRLIGGAGFNLFFIPIYALLELGILAYWYYFNLLDKDKFVGITTCIVGLGILFDLFILSNLFSVKDYKSYGKIMADAAVFLFALRYYWQGLRSTLPSKELLQINTGMVFYFTVNFLMFSSINFLVNAAPQVITVFWVLNTLVTILFYSLISYRLWQHGKIPKHLQFG